MSCFKKIQWEKISNLNAKSLDPFHSNLIWFIFSFFFSGQEPLCCELNISNILYISYWKIVLLTQIKCWHKTSLLFWTKAYIVQYCIITLFWIYNFRLFQCLLLFPKHRSCSSPMQDTNKQLCPPTHPASSHTKDC